MAANPVFLRVFGVFTLFTLLAAEVWRYSITWYGYGAILLVLASIGVYLLVQYRANWSFSRIPPSLLGFLLVVSASVVWSYYPAWTALAAFTTIVTVMGGLALAVTFSRQEILQHLATALRIIVAGSLIFELAVSTLIRRPVLPLWFDYPEGDLPAVLYWSRNALFTGDRIQGLLGNANLLGFAALLAVIVFGLQLAAGTVGRVSGVLWIGLAFAAIALTRSATITVALVVLAAVVAAVIAIGRAPLGAPRNRRYALAFGILLGGLVVAMAARSQLLAALGKSEDLTGRLEIWSTVIGLAEERPALGWGWVSYWVPWVAPFDDLIFRNGVRLLQAHNAWLDVWLQVGVVGLALFVLVVLGTLVRSWVIAIDAIADAEAPRSARVTAALPLLVMVALVVQSLAESRLLVEYGMALTALFAIGTSHAVSAGTAASSSSKRVPR